MTSWRQNKDGLFIVPSFLYVLCLKSCQAAQNHISTLLPDNTLYQIMSCSHLNAETQVYTLQGICGYCQLAQIYQTSNSELFSDCFQPLYDLDLKQKTQEDISQV